MPSAMAMAKPFATSLSLLLSCPSLYPNPQSQHKHLQTSHTCVNYSPLILATLPASIFNTITSYQNFGVSILATKPSLLVVAMPVPFCSARLLATPGAVELDFSLCLCRISISSVTWDGLEATGEIRKRGIVRNGQPIQIIALTAHAMTGDSERCIEAGMDGYLTKPIRSADLHKLLQRLAPLQVQ